MAESTEYLTTVEASKLLKVSPGTVQKLAREGRLAAIKVGRLWRFPRQSPDILLYKQKQQTWRSRSSGKVSKKSGRRQQTGWNELLKLATDLDVKLTWRSGG